MPLPILNSPTDPTPDNLVRLYHRAVLHLTRHLGTEAPLDAGTAFTNPDLADVDDANALLEAAIPEGSVVQEVMHEVEEHYRAAGVRCRSVVPNPAAPAARTAPLVEYLLRVGWRRRAADIFHRSGPPPQPVGLAAGLTIIPARASYRHARALAEECAAESGKPRVADAILAHLDDPHWDALLALKDGRAVATVGVLAVGDLGAVDELFVGAPFRRQGVGRTMLDRAMEICARSLFKHVMLSVLPDNHPAIRLYEQFGFRRIGEIVSYRQI
jgi:ribosomal protein S18 acetylase RimI-like enzyme